MHCIVRRFEQHKPTKTYPRWAKIIPDGDRPFLKDGDNRM